MKPLQWAVLGAVVAVAAILYLMTFGSGIDRAPDRRHAVTREPEPRRRPERPKSSLLTMSLDVALADGSPAKGASITLFGRAQREERTQPDGTVRISGLPAGFYSVLARKGNRAGALDFELTATTDLGTLTLHDTIAIRGRVLGSNKAAVAGARVEAVRVSERSTFDVTSVIAAMMSPEAVVARARVGEDGGYLLRVPAGRKFALRAWADGYVQESEEARRYSADVSGVDFLLFAGMRLGGVVVNRKGRPIAGAQVLLVDSMDPFERRTVKTEAISDGDGRFAFTTTPSDTLLLVVRAIGYASYMNNMLTFPATDLQIALQRGVALRMRTVEAGTSGAPAPGINVAVMLSGGLASGKTDGSGELLLRNLAIEGSGPMGSEQSAVLWGGGFVSHMKSLEEYEPTDGVIEVGDVEMQRGGTIRGRVLDATTGDPIAGASLQTVGGVSEELSIFGGARGVSGTDGRFELTGVPPEAHTLIVLHPDYNSNVDAPALDSIFDGSGGGEPIIPADRTSAERDVKLQPAATLVGRVLGPDGSGVAGATVTIQDETAMFRGMMGGHVPTAVSEAEGRFTLGGLRKGEEIEVVATHREFGRSKMLSAKPGERFEIRLTAPLVLKGVVVNDAGEPVASTRVTVSPIADESENSVSRATGEVRPAVTNAEGRFLIRNAPPGALEVTWDHRDYAPQTRRIDIEPGTSDLDLGRAVLSRAHGIEGSVVDEAGEPVPNVAVFASASFENRSGWDEPYLPEDGTVSAPGRGYWQGETDDAGRFAIYGLRAGKFGVKARRDGSYSSEEMVMAGTKDVRITLLPAGTLSGRVMSGGKPVAKALLSVRRVSSILDWAETDEEGRFRFERLPPHEAFQVEIEHDGYLDLVVKDVRATKVPREFVLDPGVHIGGLVTDLEGRPLAGVTVSVGVGNSWDSVESQANGRFSAGCLGEGEIVVHLGSSDEGYIATEPLTVAPGDMNIRLIAEKGESIAGVVLDANGAPVRKAMIRVLDDEGKHGGSDWVRNDGRFEVKGLPKGRYTVRAFTWTEGEIEPFAEATDVATGTLDLELTAR